MHATQDTPLPPLPPISLSPQTLIPLYFPHTDPALSLVLSPFSPIHLIQTHLAQSSAPFAFLAFLAPALFLAVTAACATFC